MQAAVADGHVSRPYTAVTTEREGLHVPTLTLSAAVAWLRRHFRHFVAAHAVLGGQTVCHSTHDHCCCDADVPC